MQKKLTITLNLDRFSQFLNDMEQICITMYLILNDRVFIVSNSLFSHLTSAKCRTTAIKSQ